MRVAFLLKFWLVFELAVEGTLAVLAMRWLGAPPWTAWLAVPVMFVGWRLVFFGVEFALAQHKGETVPPEHRPSALGWVRIVLGEIRVSILAFSWLQPFAALAAPWAFATSGTGRSDRPVVVLVHGLLCNGAVWRDMRRALREAGCEVEVVNLVSIYGRIEAYGDPLHRAIEDVCRRREVARVHIVAHSMGGLVVRRYLAQHGDRRIAHVVTIASPHAGTAMAELGHSPNVCDMRPASPFLATLRSDLAHRSWHDFTCMFTWQDNLVVPQRSAVLPGARERAYSGMGHLAMLFERTVIADVVDTIHAHSETRPATAPAEPTRVAA